jgi:hypothetical protein
MLERQDMKLVSVLEVRHPMPPTCTSVQMFVHRILRPRTMPTVADGRRCRTDPPVFMKPNSAVVQSGTFVPACN